MLESEWNAPIMTFEKLVDQAITMPDWERKCRLTAIAIATQTMTYYPEPECVDFINKVIEATNGKFEERIEELKKLASKKPVMMHGGLFHLVRLKPKTAILETHNKYLQDARKYHQSHSGPKITDDQVKANSCNLLRHVFGLLTPLAPLEKNGHEHDLKGMILLALDTGFGFGPLSDFVEEFYGRDDLAKHLRDYDKHPHGCHVLDILLGK